MSLLVSTTGTAPAGTTTAMRVNRLADLRMVAGLEAAMDHGYGGDLATRTALLIKYGALPLSLREKIVWLQVGDVQIDGLQAFSMSDIDMPAGAAAAVPLATLADRTTFDFSGVTYGFKAGPNPTFKQRMTGISGLFFGAIAKKVGSRGTGASANPSIALRAFTNDTVIQPARAEMLRISQANNGDWYPSVRVRPETSTTYSATPASGSTQYGKFDWLTANVGSDTQTLDWHLNTTLVQSLAVPAFNTTYLGDGAGVDLGRNSTTDNVSSQLNGSVYMSIICRAKLTDIELAALDALAMSECAALNA